MPNLDAQSREMSDFLSSLPYSYKVTATSVGVKNSYDSYEGKEVSVAGRVMGLRKSGKLVFVDVSDKLGKIQLYFDYSLLSEQVFTSAKKLNTGDIVGARGTVFKTKAGEPTIKVIDYQLLSKAIMMLPDKWHGIKEAEIRYRKRHLDLIMNQEIKDLFAKRSRTVSEIRRFLDSKDYMEFETPTIQPLYGGAEAEPFKVFVNTLGEEHYLRISNELYLKRLIIGGMERVYEIYRAFRNEDIDSTHSPEFTMIEWYQAYADYNDMMDITEKMIHHVSNAVNGSDSATSSDGTTKIGFKLPFKRIKYIDSLSKKLGFDISEKSEKEVIEIAEKNGIKLEKSKRNKAHAYDKLFSKLVQPDLVQPTFVIDFPKESSPLTRVKRGDNSLIERFELYIDKIEIANSYSELNNPIIQRENFEDEMKKMKAGDKEAEPLDMDFVEAMEHGMPPTGGVGVGIDRLVMVLTGVCSIKEVILFPMEKRGKPLPGK